MSSPRRRSRKSIAFIVLWSLILYPPGPFRLQEIQTVLAILRVRGIGSRQFHGHPVLPMFHLFYISCAQYDPIFSQRWTMLRNRSGHSYLYNLFLQVVEFSAGEQAGNTILPGDPSPQRTTLTAPLVHSQPVTYEVNVTNGRHDDLMICPERKHACLPQPQPD